MLNRLALAALLLAGLGGLAAASAPSPYAAFADRPIKALSAEAVADLRAGRGMGLALAAELNGWPGPLHVLELADALGLDAVQRAATERLRAAMSAEARRLGGELIAEEAALDAAFALRTIAPAALEARLARIGALQGALRAVHLRTHLDQAALLTPAQVAAYARLRGYAAAPAPAPQGHDPARHNPARHGH